MKCKTLAIEYKVLPMQIGRLRKKFAPNETGDISLESEALIREYFAELETTETRTEMEEAVKEGCASGTVGCDKSSD